jgi:hypothetical protein
VGGSVKNKKGNFPLDLDISKTQNRKMKLPAVRCAQPAKKKMAKTQCLYAKYKATYKIIIISNNNEPGKYTTIKKKRENNRESRRSTGICNMVY